MFTVTSEETVNDPAKILTAPVTLLTTKLFAAAYKEPFTTVSPVEALTVNLSVLTVIPPDMVIDPAVETTNSPLGPVVSDPFRTVFALVPIVNLPPATLIPSVMVKDPEKEESAAIEIPPTETRFPEEA